jgi:repressor LexA
MNNRIRELRQQYKITQNVLSKKIGVAQNTLSYWENGKYDIDNESLQKLADVFNCTIDYLLCRNDNVGDINLRPLTVPLSAGGKIPVLGKIPAGVPIEAVQEIVDEIEISGRLAEDSHEYFALLVTGDSMFPEYQDGDIVIVRKQETADTGDDVVAYINGYDATLKRLVRSPLGLTLRALNPAYESKTFSSADVENVPVRIAGVVVEQRRSRK